MVDLRTEASVHAGILRRHVEDVVRTAQPQVLHMIDIGTGLGAVIGLAREEAT